MTPRPANPPQPTILISSSQRASRVPRKKLAELIRFVANRQAVRLGTMDLAIVNRSEIAALNRRYLGHRGATDVLSFDLSDGSRQGLCAQIVVCGDVAARQAGSHGLSVQHELMLYVIHALLHLMGYEDASVRGAARMCARQEELLREFFSSPSPRS